MFCPNCGKKRDPLDQRQLKPLDRNARFEDELNIVYLCVKHTGGCGHVFSPTDKEILQVWKMWLSGQLVPADQNDEPTRGGEQHGKHAAAAA